MKLETWDECEDQNPFFCWSCGKQLIITDEIKERICADCKKSPRKKPTDNTFYCWACGKPLRSMDEVAQGICAACRSAILRKLR